MPRRKRLAPSWLDPPPEEKPTHSQPTSPRSPPKRCAQNPKTLSQSNRGGGCSQNPNSANQSPQHRGRGQRGLSESTTRLGWGQRWRFRGGVVVGGHGCGVRGRDVLEVSGDAVGRWRSGCGSGVVPSTPHFAPASPFPQVAMAGGRIAARAWVAVARPQGREGRAKNTSSMAKMQPRRATRFRHVASAIRRPGHAGRPPGQGGGEESWMKWARENLHIYGGSFGLQHKLMSMSVGVHAHTCMPACVRVRVCMCSYTHICNAAGQCWRGQQTLCLLLFRFFFLLASRAKL